MTCFSNRLVAANPPYCDFARNRGFGHAEAEKLAGPWDGRVVGRVCECECETSYTFLNALECHSRSYYNAISKVTYRLPGCEEIACIAKNRNWLRSLAANLN
jgi:hypothetical protein